MQDGVEARVQQMLLYLRAPKAIPDGLRARNRLFERFVCDTFPRHPITTCILYLAKWRPDTYMSR